MVSKPKAPPITDLVEATEAAIVEGYRLGVLTELDRAAVQALRDLAVKISVQDEYFDALRDDRLAVLAGHQHDDLAEPEQRIERPALAHGGDGPHGVQLERMDQQPALPREQGDPQHLAGELDHHETERGFLGQFTQRRSEDPRDFAALILGRPHLWFDGTSRRHSSPPPSQ